MKSEEIENKKRFSVIENETGEIVTQQDKVYWRTEKQNEAWKKMKEKEGQDQIFKDFQTQELGGFVFMIYNNIDVLSSQLELQVQDIPKLVYLSSYLNYDNVLAIGNNLMTKKDIQEKLGLSRNVFSKFFKTLIEKQILIEIKIDKANCFKFNEEFLKKGIVNTDKMKTKMYINSIRYLYEHTSIRMHKNLAIAYQVIPYVHKDTNMICSNPFEPNHDLIKPLSIKEICELLGYNLEGANAKNITKIKKALTSLTLEDNSPVLKWLNASGLKKERWLLNPKVVSNFISLEQYNKFYMAENWVFNELA